MDGLVFNIQRYSLHDGPGIRTVVFLKGCPMRCRWCANPESQRMFAEISYLSDRCIGEDACGDCATVCPTGAISYGEKAYIDREKCNHCLICAKHCPSKSIRVEGQLRSCEEILDIVEQDSVFYRDGEGGLTVSGGEPLSQGLFLIELLKEAKKRHIHTAMETCGQGQYEILHAAASYLDVLLYDVKGLDEAKHILYTGCSNTMILQNLKRLSEDMPGLKKIVRTPVIPGFNDTPAELREIKAFAATICNAEHELLPYHRFGEGKYKSLGMPYLMGDAYLDLDILRQI